MFVFIHTLICNIQFTHICYDINSFISLVRLFLENVAERHVVQLSFQGPMKILLLLYQIFPNILRFIYKYFSCFTEKDSADHSGILIYKTEQRYVE